jgi:hypothetical protein
MKYLKLFGVALIALLTVGLTATSSFAITLPDLSIALGGSYPLHLEVTMLNVAVEFSTTGAESFKGTGLLLLFLTEQLTSLGSYELLYTSVLNPSDDEECFSESGTTKDPAGEVLTLGTFHIVLRPGGLLGILYLLQPLKLVCGTVTIHLRGSVLSSLNGAGTEGSELTSLRGLIHGTTGRPELTEYLNDGGTIVGAKLELDFGTGFVQSTQTIATEVTATALEGKMFIITTR